MRHLYNNTFTHQRLTTVYDSYGTPIEATWETVGTIRGRLRPTTVAEVELLGGVVGITITHVFYCGPETDIRRGDRIVLGDTVVEITAVKDPSYAGHHLECEGKAIQ